MTVVPTAAVVMTSLVELTVWHGELSMRFEHPLPGAGWPVLFVFRHFTRYWILSWLPTLAVCSFLGVCRLEGQGTEVQQAKYTAHGAQESV